MITDCPSCLRQFRIYAHQLAAASGMVQCGFCGAQFNALPRLRDEPGDYPAEPVPLADAADETEEPWFDVPARTDMADTEFAGPDPEHPGISSDTADTLEDPESWLRTDTAPRRSPLATVSWSLACLCLILTLLVQYAWFNRDRLLPQQPHWRDRIAAFCERYDCDLVRDRNLSAIEIVNRDVRDHPRYANMLLVNITLRNTAQYDRPYPSLRLLLYDGTGRVTGYRIFRPEEYLDPGVDIEHGMPAGVPVHSVLEIAGATGEAVSFEFHFI